MPDMRNHNKEPYKCRFLGVLVNLDAVDSEVSRFPRKDRDRDLEKFTKGECWLMFATAVPRPTHLHSLELEVVCEGFSQESIGSSVPLWGVLPQTILAIPNIGTLDPLGKLLCDAAHS